MGRMKSHRTGWEHPRRVWKSLRKRRADSEDTTDGDLAARNKRGGIWSLVLQNPNQLMHGE